MKKWFLLLLLLCLTACGEKEAPIHLVPEGCMPLEEALTGTEIQYTEVEGGVLLEEDGLTVGLTTADVYLYRNTCITGAMEQPLQWDEDGIYVPVEFYEDYLLAGHESPSLYHGASFFPEECLAALQEPEQHQKLLAELVLPGSLDVETPNLDKSRIFYPAPVNDAQAKELAQWGFPDDRDWTLGEYEVIRGGRTLGETDIPCQDYRDAFPEADWENVKVKDFLDWQAGYRLQVQMDHLSTPDRKFLEEKSIQITDLPVLRRFSPKGFKYMDDEWLRKKLAEEYQRTIDGLRKWVGMANVMNQNPDACPDWWPPLRQFDHVYNYGPCLGTVKNGTRQDFYPDGTVQTDNSGVVATYFGTYQVLKYYKMVQRPGYGLQDMEGNLLVEPDYQWTGIAFPADYVSAVYLPEEARFLVLTAAGEEVSVPLSEILS